MSTLKTNDKQVLEKLFQMGGGYVLNFSDRTMEEFFRDNLRINIYSDTYNLHSGSKANRMRGFWMNASDELVSRSILELIAYINNQILLDNYKQEDYPKKLLDKAKEIAENLAGTKKADGNSTITEEEFINKDFKNISIAKLGLDGVISGILEQRMEEIRKCLNAKSSLAVIFLCGSTLEGILLGIASMKAQDFNQSPFSPKDKLGKVKQLQNWKLNDFINVARSLNLLGEDVKKFSHALRDFRNYIHPYQQMSSNFDPDEHTAKICWQVLRAAIAQLSK